MVIEQFTFQVDTVDGKNSFHALAMTAYQREPETDSIDYISEPLDLTDIASHSLESAPDTVIPLTQSIISGSPLVQKSPHYRGYVPFQNSVSCELPDIVWLLARHHNRTGKQTVPIWSAFNSILQSNKEKPLLDKAHPLPLLNAPAHEWSSLTTALLQMIKLNQLTTTTGVCILP